MGLKEMWREFLKAHNLNVRFIRKYHGVCK